MKDTDPTLRPLRNPNTSGEPQNVARVHRFRDRVAVFIGDGPTRYLTADEANNLAAALVMVATNVWHQPKASESTLLPQSIFRADD